MNKKIKTATFHAELSRLNFTEVYAKVIYSRGCSPVLYGENMHDGEPDELEEYELFDAETKKEISLDGVSENYIAEIENQIWGKIYNNETNEQNERD